MKGIIILLFVCGLFSCKPQTKATHENWAEFYKDSTFLEVEGNLLEDWSQTDRRIYGQAHARMSRCMYIQHDTLSWDIKNGAEIRISENIYDYLTTIWHLDNLKLKTDTVYEIRKNTQAGGYFVTRKDLPEDMGLIKIQP